MTDKVFTLPEKDQMLTNLLKVDDEQHLQERFYPKLLKDAGTQKVPMGVLMMLELALYDYVKGLPAMMNILMRKKLPAFIDAVCPDEESAQLVKDYLAEVNSNLK